MLCYLYLNGSQNCKKKRKYMAEKTQMIITGIICLLAIIGTIRWIKKSYSSDCKIESNTCDNCPLKSTNCNKNK